MTTVRLIAGVVLLIAAALLTWSTVEELSARRAMRFDLAEISHVRYGMLNANVWVEKLTPILDANIEALDFKPETQAGLRTMVQSALYRLLDEVKEKMSKPAPAKPGAAPAPSGGFFSVTGNPMVVNMIVGALKPQVPEFTAIVLRELGRPESKAAIKTYIKGVLAEGAKNTFGNLDLSVHSAILEKYGCKDADACHQEINRRVAAADQRINVRYLSVLGATFLAFVLLLTGGPVLRPASAVILLSFCVVLLLGGIFTPMLEVEAKISGMSLTLLGKPVSFSDQVLYFQSKSVLEVFRALIDTGKLDMWIVGVLVLTFCIIFPVLKLIASITALFAPNVLQKSAIFRFFALESSKWSMADVFALAIFMSFVAFNGLIPNTMKGLLETGADIRIPTDSSKILPGYHIFIGFCLASLFLSRKLGKSLLLPRPAADGRSEEVEQHSRPE